jgi:hypothetical protein
MKKLMKKPTSAVIPSAFAAPSTRAATVSDREALCAALKTQKKSVSFGVADEEPHAGLVGKPEASHAPVRAEARSVVS